MRVANNPDGYEPDEIEVTPEMIEAGAFALIENYSGPEDSAQAASRAILLAAFRAAALRRAMATTGTHKVTTRPWPFGADVAMVVGPLFVLCIIAFVLH